MAKKRKTKKSKSRRRSTVGAIDMTTTLGVIGGVVAGKMLDKVIPATMNPKIAAGAKILVGVGAPMLMKSPKAKATVTAVGAGIAGVGAIDLLKSFGVVSGNDEEITVELNGDDLPVINGDDLPVINGDIEDANEALSGEEEMYISL